MNRNHGLEVFATTVNDIDKHYPKSRSRCFDIGIWGGCGVTCAAFLDGECEEPQEIAKQDIIDEHGEDDAKEVFAKYQCFQ
jgi:hypothetical protein